MGYGYYLSRVSTAWFSVTLEYPHRSPTGQRKHSEAKREASPHPPSRRRNGMATQLVPIRWALRSPHPPHDSQDPRAMGHGPIITLVTRSTAGDKLCGKWRGASFSPGGSFCLLPLWDLGSLGILGFLGHCDPVPEEPYSGFHTIIPLAMICYFSISDGA